jgi:hypothetical protein
MLPPHIAEHSPRDLEWICVDSVLALARGMFGIRAECERRCVWCRFSVPHRRTLLSQYEETREIRLLIAMCGRVHSWSNLRRVRSAMCRGSIRCETECLFSETPTATLTVPVSEMIEHHWLSQVTLKSYTNITTILWWEVLGRTNRLLSL